MATSSAAVRRPLPIDITVERARAGRTYASRRIDVRQEGKTIFAMLASFHAEEPGPRVRPRDARRTFRILTPSRRRPGSEWDPGIEVRTVEAEGAAGAVVGPDPRPFPADPLMHYCGLLYASDLRAGGAAMAAIGFNDLRPVRDADP